MLMLSEANFQIGLHFLHYLIHISPLLQRRELCIVVDIENDVWGEGEFFHVVCCILYIVYCILYSCMLLVQIEVYPQLVMIQL